MEEISEISFGLFGTCRLEDVYHFREGWGGVRVVEDIMVDSANEVLRGRIRRESDDRREVVNSPGVGSGFQSAFRSTRNRGVKGEILVETRLGKVWRVISGR